MLGFLLLRNSSRCARSSCTLPQPAPSGSIFTTRPVMRESSRAVSIASVRSCSRVALRAATGWPPTGRCSSIGPPTSSTSTALEGRRRYILIAATTPIIKTTKPTKNRFLPRVIFDLPRRRGVLRTDRQGQARMPVLLRWDQHSCRSIGILQGLLWTGRNAYPTFADACKLPPLTESIQGRWMPLNRSLGLGHPSRRPAALAPAETGVRDLRRGAARGETSRGIARVSGGDRTNVEAEIFRGAYTDDLGARYLTARGSAQKDGFPRSERGLSQKVCERRWQLRQVFSTPTWASRRKRADSSGGVGQI